MRERNERPRAGLPGDPAADLDDEIRAHLEMRAADLVAQGLTPEAAREEALRRFGDLEQAKSAIVSDLRRRDRRVRRAAHLETFARDVAHAFRRLTRSRGYAALATLILACSIGLSAATFAVTDHVLLRPFPYPEPDRLVALMSEGEEGPFYSVSIANWVDWKERGTSLEATALWQVWRMTIGAGADPFRVDGVVAIGDLWGTLRPRFVSGRGFTEAEAQAGEPLAVVGEALWRGALGTRPLEGLTVEVDGVRREVVGVVADGQGFPEGAEVWVPGRWTPGSGAMRNNVSYDALARLAPGANVVGAAEELSAIARGIREREPEAIYSYGVGVRSLQERVSGGARGPVVALMGAVLLVLAVACANLAGLGLARARRTADETAVRLALGAGRGRLVRQVLAEQAILAVVGAAIGVGLAWVATERLLAAVAGHLPRAGSVTVDGPVLLFAGVAAALAALTTSVGPTLAVVRSSASRTLEGTRGRIRGGRGLPGAWMVATELALATALLIGGGLLVRSFAAATSRPLGFDPEGVVTLEVTLTGSDYDDPAQAVAYWERLLARLHAAPEVEAAAVGNWIPTGGSGTTFLELEGGDDADIGAGYRVVSDAYFRAMGTPLVEGRAFRPSDAPGGERVGVVNRALAERYFPGETAIGKRVRATSMEAFYYGGEAPWITVVGVVGEVRHDGFESEPRPELFVLHRQVPDWTRAMTAVVRTRDGLDAEAALAGLRDVAREVDPGLAIEAGTLAARVRALLAERRLVLGVLWTFAALAVALACLGIYALVSFATEERTREFAIRAALGADRSGIFALVLGDAGRVVLGGLLAGVLAGYALTRLIRSLLVDVSATDPLTYVLAALALALVGVGAALAPSWRAARTDPMKVLGG